MSAHTTDRVVALDVQPGDAVACFATRQRVEVRNLDDREEMVWVAADDPTDRLRLVVRPEQVAVPAGGVASVVVWGRPVGPRRRLRGQSVRVVVTAVPPTAPPSSVEVTCRFGRRSPR